MSAPIKSSTVPMGSVPMGAAVAPEEKRTSGMAIASMVCGIISLFFFGMILGIVAIVLGTVAKNQIKNRPQELQGDCQASAGIACGAVAIIVWIIIVIVYISG